MEKKRTLIINSAVCDAREVREETLAACDVVINSGLVLANREARDLLNRYSVTINGGDLLDAQGEVEIATFRGAAEIGPGQLPPRGKCILKGSGTLTIVPGSEAVLEHYLAIKVSGSVVCPQSLSPCLTMLKLSGTLSCYPDGAVLLKQTTLLDRTFHLRTRQDACYFASRRVVALDPAIDFEAMARKHVRFVTRELLVAESLAEAAVPLFDEKAEITILPDGCAFLPRDVTLDETLLLRQGGKLYIKGDLTVPGGSAGLLGQVTYLYVRGDIRIDRGLMSLLGAIPDLRYDGELQPLSGALIEDRINLVVDRELLENSPQGLTITGCVNVKFREDISPQLIRDRLLRLEECVNVTCTEAQRAAIEPVAVEVIRLGTGAPLGGWIGDMLQGLLGAPGQEEKSVSNTQVINTDTYKL